MSALKVQLPLLLQFAATFIGSFVAVRHFHGPQAVIFLIGVPLVTQLGAWGDLGVASALVFEYGGGQRTLGDLNSAALGALRRAVRRCSLLSLLTVPPVVGLSLLGAEGLPRFVLQIALLILATLAINAGNVLRQVLLADNRITAYFWTFIWVTAILPLAAAFSDMPALAMLGVGVSFVLQQIAVSRIPLSSMLRRMPAREAPARSGKLVNAIGLSQVVLALGSTLDLAIVSKITPGLIAYYAGTRLSQAILSFAYRPLEAGVPHLARLAHDSAALPRASQAWQRAVRSSHLTFVLGGILVCTGGGVFSELWLGRRGHVDLLLMIALLMSAAVTLLHRQRVLVACAQERPAFVVLHSAGDFASRIALGAALTIATHDARGMAFGALASVPLLLVGRIGQRQGRRAIAGASI